MPNLLLDHLVRYCDRMLSIDAMEDWPGACNGLQVANKGKVTAIAAAVDASSVTIKKAIDNGADLLIVHHGLFWGKTTPWIGKRYQMIRLLVENNLAVYSVHLPLDVHPRYGNNICICKALGFNKLKPFFLEKNHYIGWQTNRKIPLQDLLLRLESVLHQKPHLLPGGPSICEKIGVVSGGAGDKLSQAALEGVDTFITGEGPHWTYALAEDFGINVIYGGHYATETFGIRALAEHLGKKFHLPWSFIDHPTGL